MHREPTLEEWRATLAEFNKNWPTWDSPEMNRARIETYTEADLQHWVDTVARYERRIAANIPPDPWNYDFVLWKAKQMVERITTYLKPNY